VPIGATRFERADLLTAFEKAYWDRFEIALGEMRCFVVNVRTAVIGRRRTVPLHGLAGGRAGRAGAALGNARSGERRVWFESGWAPTPIYRREALPEGAEFVGPAIIEQFDATTVVEPGDRVRVDALGNLEIRVAGAQGAS
jgi:N-methylhydantoinase A